MAADTDWAPTAQVTRSRRGSVRWRYTATRSQTPRSLGRRGRREANMVARIGTWEGSPEELDRWVVRGREQVKPHIRQDPGLKAVYWLVDRKAGEGMIVTLLGYEASMSAIEQC